MENTLPGFRYSGNVLKTDLLELDCHLTKDKIAVVIHDSSLKRLCGVDDRVENFDYDSLPKLLIPPSLQSVADVVDDKDSYRIPKLEELLAEFPAYPMQIDLKQGPVNKTSNSDPLSCSNFSLRTPSHRKN